MTAAAVIELRPRGMCAARLRRLRKHDGFGLVELLIALMILNVGIFATVAAFNSGVLALRRASHVSAAAALADKQMEAYSDSSYAGIAAIAPVTLTGPDSRQYQLAATVNETSQKTGVTYPGNSKVKVVTLTVRDVAEANKLLVTTSSTFEQCTQDRTTTACGG